MYIINSLFASPTRLSAKRPHRQARPSSALNRGSLARPNRPCRAPIRRWVHIALLGILTGGGCPADEAPTGYDNATNGYLPQPLFDSEARPNFELIQSIEMGLGPLYNAQSCAECHQNPVTGGNSQISQLRVGIFDGVRFNEPRGGSLIHDRAIEPAIQPHASAKANVRTLRMAPGTLGDGYVEVIADETLLALAREQPDRSGGLIHGEAIMVDVVEAPGTRHVGRFGWKDTHSSLLSFIAEAAVDELGITSSLFLEERTSNGRSVTQFDDVRDPEDRGVVLYATQFVRSTKAPPRDAGIAETPSAQAGAAVFETIGCGICHVASLTTAPAGTIINGGRYQVPLALGEKTIHPYSDYLLHAVGTGDGIVQNGGQATRQKLRTAPLWGLRTRSRLLHDGSALTLEQAILRHRGEAAAVTDKFRDLSKVSRRDLLRFLSSL